jgi:pyruvate dehydrogenase E2 component (dihydrolipoamide acetyltransferase)
VQTRDFAIASFIAWPSARSPRAVPDGQEIAVRSMMTMTLSADHRIVDGAIAARFLQEVKRLLEKPPV